MSMTHKRLNDFVGKEVVVETKNGSKYQGILWRYYKDYLCRDNDYIYYVGYDGGFMEELLVSQIKRVELCKEEQ